MNISTIIACTSKLTMIPEPLLTGPSRKKYVTRARFAIYLLAHEYGHGYAQIGRLLGGRDHHTIIYGVRQATDMVKLDPAFRHLVQTLRRDVVAAPKVVIRKALVDLAVERKIAAVEAENPWADDEYKVNKALLLGSDRLARAINRAGGHGNHGTIHRPA